MNFSLRIIIIEQFHIILIGYIINNYKNKLKKIQQFIVYWILIIILFSHYKI